MNLALTLTLRVYDDGNCTVDVKAEEPNAGTLRQLVLAASAMVALAVQAGAPREEFLEAVSDTEHTIAKPQ
jgi:hypothetical protein